MASQYRVLGFEEAINTCDCCGKTNLKGTFAVERADGEILHYGSVCVTRHTGKAPKVVRQEAKDATESRRQVAVAEYIAMGTDAALSAKLAALHAAGTPIGKSFREACRAESDADTTARAAIAAKHGFKPFELMA